MALEPIWYYPNHLIHVYGYDAVTLTNIQHLFSWIRRHVYEDHGGLVHLMIDLREVSALNLSMRDVHRLVHAMSDKRIGYAVLVAPRSATYLHLVRTLAALASEQDLVRIVFAESQHEGLSFLAEMDAGIAACWQAQIRA